MIGLNISNYNEDSEYSERSVEMAASDATVRDATPVEESTEDAAADRRDLFELARSISNRAYSRRRVRRSSAII